MSDELEAKYKRRVERERAARKQAEQLLEEKSLELFYTLQSLEELNKDLDEQVKIKSAEAIESKEAAEHASQAKSDFLATMSHEIRTPLNAIIGFIQLLAGSNLNEREMLFIKNMDGASQGLLALINDLLDISKIEAGKLDLESIPFKVNQSLNEAVSLYQAKADEQGTLLQFESDCDDSFSLLGDPYRLNQIMKNFLSNAVKFTKSGTVTLTVSTNVCNNQCSLSIGCKDTGIGINQDRVGQLFDKFSQADSSTTREYGGTGLGLAICIELAKLMNASVDVASEIGEGSSFTLTVDLPIADNAITSTVGESSATSIKGTTILLAEDNPVNQLLAVSILEDGGAIVTVANDGQEAVDICADNCNFDLILMDMQMPRLDGIGACKQIRQLGIDIPIVALTANAMAEDRVRCIEAGMNQFMSKPFKIDELLSTIADAAP